MHQHYRCYKEKKFHGLRKSVASVACEKKSKKIFSQNKNGIPDKYVETTQGTALVIGSVFALLLINVVGFIYSRRRRMQEKKFMNQPAIASFGAV